MTPSSLEFHFIVSLILAILSGGLWLHSNRGSGLFLGGAASVLGALTAGLAKELVDLFLNPWSLPFASLRRDSALDMLWNLCGALAGMVLLMAAMGVARIVQNRARSPFIPAGGPQ